MREISRRQLLGGAAALTVAGCSSGKSNQSASSTTSTTSTVKPLGSLSDIDHVIIHVQENRSFDHYFGTRPGVLGFADPKAPKTGVDGKAVWYQPTSSNADGYLLPWHLDTVTRRGQCVVDPDHSWEGQHAAWNGGRMDGFAEHIGTVSMGYFEPDDLPYYTALADEFTMCDHYHCSVMGPTGPNRLYLMSATIDPSGAAGGPNTGGDGTFRWETYPERLSAAGISWRVYHEVDDYDDNELKFFARFQNLAPTDPFYDAAIVDRDADAFARDAAAGNLPQVTWIVSPTIPSEHPPFAPAYGERYTSGVLAAVTGNAELWAKSLVVLAYDENGGFFDHVPPPVPPKGTPDEFVGDLPIGLGFRVPAMVISPWSRGGRVVSQTFDHTSTLRLLETRFGVEVANLSAWRRETCADLSAALDFTSFDPSVPELPPTDARAEQANLDCGALPDAAPPSPQALPV